MTTMGGRTLLLLRDMISTQSNCSRRHFAIANQGCWREIRGAGLLMSPPLRGVFFLTPGLHVDWRLATLIMMGEWMQWLRLTMVRPIFCTTTLPPLTIG